MSAGEHRCSFRGMTGIIAVFVVAGVIISISFRFAEWRSNEVLLPGYCDGADGHIAVLKKIISEKNPAENRSLRPYIKAARLLYLVPRRGTEPVDEYLVRVSEEIKNSCP